MSADDDARPGHDQIVQRLRAAGCVFAEAEAEQVVARFADSAERERAVVRREGGAPLEHVLGHAVFDGLRVAVEPGVFVPRRRAEPLVDLAADGFQTSAGSACMVDLGCGSGAIAAALTVRLPAATVLATDIDARATACARRNGESYGFTVHLGDWFEGLPTRYRGRVDVAVAYLPHVPTRNLDGLDPDYRRAEPLATVHGGPDGLDPLRAVLVQAPRWLRAGGVLVTMSAAEQEPAVRAVAGEPGWLVETHPLDDDVFYRLRPPPALLPLSQGAL